MVRSQTNKTATVSGHSRAAMRRGVLRRRAEMLGSARCITALRNVYFERLDMHPHLEFLSVGDGVKRPVGDRKNFLD